MDVFTWSLPFVGEKSEQVRLSWCSCSQTESPAVTVTDMLIAILNCCTKEELEEDEEEEATPEEAVTPVQEGEAEAISAL